MQGVSVLVELLSLLLLTEIMSAFISERNLAAHGDDRFVAVSQGLLNSRHASDLQFICWYAWHVAPSVVLNMVINSIPNAVKQCCRVISQTD